MLGDYGEAEDVVSDVALEAVRQEQRVDGSTHSEPVASWPKWLTTVCVRRSIDRARKLARRREDYPGPWMPEPLAPDRLPEEAVLGRELLGIALLHVAEQLHPEARAALILHRAFELTAPEIGGILDRTPAAVRQLISRAERRLRKSGHLAEAGAPGGATATPGPQIVSRLQAAIENGDLESVVEALVPGAVLWADGGGQVRSALNPVFGAERIARFLTGIRAKSLRRHPHLNFGFCTLELVSETALAFAHNDRWDLLLVEVSSEGLASELRLISNPDKLRRAGVE
jgi:RNA polymerase sigma factor (sigma-70 family)